MECNICNGQTFGVMGTRPNVRCERCGSLERSRLMWLFLERLTLDQNTKVLHIAPEKGIYFRLKSLLSQENYITADINPDGYAFADNMKKLDLCNLESLRSLEFDLIIHSHVLEHTPCSLAYTLWHLHRILKIDGHHICVIPFLAGRYDECYQAIGDEERIRRFGQSDHVRRITFEDVDDHIGKLLKLPLEFDATKEFDELTLTKANIPKSCWYGFTPSTVLSLQRSDMKLLSTKAFD